jgi:transposase-like protein
MQQLMTITALARAEGVCKALMSKRVKQLNLKTLPGPRGAKLVAVPSYLQAMGRPGKLGPAADQLELLARKGELGGAAESVARLKAARSYQGLVKEAAGSDMKAAARIREIHLALGLDATELCRALLIEERPLRSFRDPDKFHLLRCFRAHLDCIAEVLAAANRFPERECSHHY